MKTLLFHFIYLRFIRPLELKQTNSGFATSDVHTFFVTRLFLLAILKITTIKFSKSKTLAARPICKHRVCIKTASTCQLKLFAQYFSAISIRLDLEQKMIF